MSDKKILILPGDGIGQEVMAQVERIVQWMNELRDTGFNTEYGLIGGAALDDQDNPLPPETLKLAMESDAVLMGAIGGPKWDDYPFDKKPERGLLGIRKEMGLFANLRPAVVYDALVDASTLKPELVKGLDIMIVRELIGGLYFGEPRGIEDLGGGKRRGFNTLTYTSEEVHRIGRIGFELAQKRQKKLMSIDKANVLETSVMWREEMEAIKGDYSDVALSHMYVDNAAMQLVRQPKQFDVIVTTNMFGDILSDCAAMLTGSLGMLPSASLGEADDSGRRKAIYEPVHGTAPDIAGQDKANPLACVGSLSMMMRYSFDMNEAADLIDQAVAAVLNAGIRTADIMVPGATEVGCRAMGDALIEELNKLAA